MVVVLFTQLITSAYACPTIATATTAPVAAASMPDCDGNMPGAMDPDQPQLCQAHCSQGLQAVQSTPGADTAPVPLVLLAILDWTHVTPEQTLRADRLVPAATGAPPPGAPPIYLSLLVLRN